MFLLFMLAGSMCNVVHAQQKYLCDITMEADRTMIQTVTFDNIKQTLEKKGCTVLDMDMNRGAGGFFVGVGYKYTTDPSKSIKDIKIFIGDEFWPYLGDGKHDNPNVHVFNGRKYKGPYCININDFGSDLNQGAGGPCMYIYYSTEDDPNYPVEGVTELTAVCPETELTSMGEWEEVGGWDGTNVYNLVDANLGTTIHNNYIYLGFKTLKSGLFLDGNAQTSWENLNANINNSSTETVNLSAGRTTTKGIINATLVNTWNYNNETTKILALTGTSSTQPIIGTLSTPLINVQKGTVKMAGMEIINYGQGATMHQEGGKLILNSGSISTVTTRALVVDGGEIALGATEVGYYDDLPCEGFIGLTVNHGASISYDPANGKPRFYGITTDAATLGTIMPDDYTLADYETGEVLTREEMLSQSITERWLTLAPCPHEMPLDAFADGDYKCCRCGTTMHFHINHAPATAEGTTCATCGETIVSKMNIAAGEFYYTQIDKLFDAVERNVRTTSRVDISTIITLYGDCTVADGASLNYNTPSTGLITFKPLNEDAKVTITGNVSAPLISVNNAKAVFGNVSVSNTNSQGAALLIGSTGELQYTNGILSCANNDAALRIDDGGLALLEECELTSANIGSHKLRDIMPYGEEKLVGQAVYTKNQGNLVHLDDQYSGHLPYHLYIQACDDHEFVRQGYEGDISAIRCKWCGYIEDFDGYFALLTYSSDEKGLTTEKISGFGKSEFEKVNRSSTPATLVMLANMTIDGSTGELKKGHELTITHAETVEDGELTLRVHTTGYEIDDWDYNSLGVNDGATLNIKGVNVSNDYHWAIYNEGTLNLYSGTITASQPVYCDDGTFNMYGGTLVGLQTSTNKNSSSPQDYGALGIVKYSVFNMYGGTIRTETARTDDDRQHSLEVLNNSTVHLYGGTLENGFFSHYSGATLIKFLTDYASAKVDGVTCEDPSSVGDTYSCIVIECKHNWSEWSVVSQTYNESDNTFVTNNTRTCSVCHKEESQVSEALTAVATKRTIDGITYLSAHDFESPMTLNENSSLTLLQDITIGGPINIGEEVSVFVIGNYTLTAAKDNSIFNNNGVLSLNNVKINTPSAVPSIVNNGELTLFNTNLNDTYSIDTKNDKINCFDVTYTRNSIQHKWGTIAVPFAVAVNADQPYELYTLSQLNGNELTLTKVTGTLKASTPALIRMKDAALNGEGTYDLSIKSSLAGRVDVVPGLSADGITYTGTYCTAEVAAGAGYLFNGNKFVKTTAATTVSPYSAYLAGAIDGISVITLPGSILVGDINEDGSITIADITLLIKALNAGTSVEDLPAADLDGEGVINLDDLEALHAKILNLQPVEGE